MSEIVDPAMITWEHVDHVSNNYDGPLEGVANFKGVPHLFVFHDEIVRKIENPDDDEDDFDYDRIYALYPLEPQLLEDLKEQHAIFEHWHQAYVQNPDAMEHHPAMPEYRERYTQLKAQNQPALDALKAGVPEHVLSGDFRSNRREVPAGYSRWSTFEVSWMDAPIA